LSSRKVKTREEIETGENGAGRSSASRRIGTNYTFAEDAINEAKIKLGEERR